MKSPKLRLLTDDDMSMNSTLDVFVNKTLNRIELKHERQNGSVEEIQLFPSQVEHLVKFLLESKAWIYSGYKEKMKPESFEEKF